MSLPGLRDWSRAARSAFREVCTIICVIEGHAAMIWESSWSKTSRTRSGRFGSASAEIGPSKRSRPPGSWLSHLVPSAISELSADNEVALELTLWDSVKDGSTAELESYLERYPEGTFASLARTRLDAAAPSSAGRAAPTPEEVAAEALDLAFWNSVKDSNRREEFRAYLEQHPNGHFAGLARARLSSSDVA